ncbi:hypothetical protein HMPREF3212_02962 [Citrobacter freundii]|nr:hypothetical protein HMPREF3212_02962 [Citrobacter freundii]
MICNADKCTSPAPGGKVRFFSLFISRLNNSLKIIHFLLA